MATQAVSSGTDTNLGFILEQVAKEKGIDKKILVETIEAAILKAAQSAFGPRVGLGCWLDLERVPLGCAESSKTR